MKKVKAAFNKADGDPNAQARALLQLRDTPLASDLPSPAEILHGQPTQGAVLPKTTQTHQYHTNLLKTDRDTELSKRTV